MHPVAFAGWVGMVVTMLNLVPSGMFDGGHVARSIMNDKSHKIVSYIGIHVVSPNWMVDNGHLSTCSFLQISILDL